jgi:hypothetical protein
MTHEIVVTGADIQGAVQGASPALLQMYQEDFPERFQSDLATVPTKAAQLSTTQTLNGSFAQPATLYQPMQRIVHLAMMQLACDAVGQPQLDPLRVDTIGVVIRRLRVFAGASSSSPYDPNPPYEAWMKSAAGQYQWRVPGDADADPDPAQRPHLQSGQAHLDAQLAAVSLSQAWSEVYTPGFLAPPATNTALNRTIVYGLVPTASSDVTNATPVAVSYKPDDLAAVLPTILKNNGGAPSAPASGATVDYRWLSDAYASASPQSAPDFATFAAALLLLYRQFGAFDGTATGNAVLAVLAKKNVTFTVTDTSGNPTYPTESMANFFAAAKQVLIDYDPAAGGAIPTLTMPTAWDAFSADDQSAFIAAVSKALQSSSSQVQFPTGRYQDATRLYQLRVFFRIKGHTKDCPTQLYWSDYSDVFRIAPWYDSSQRMSAPIPLPDPTLRSLLMAKPNVAFAVPKGLMNAMQGASMSKLLDGSASGGSFNLNWICGFNIPIITICAFFILTIFLTLLNVVFYWLPFVKICIPFPEPAPGEQG